MFRLPSDAVTTGQPGSRCFRAKSVPRLAGKDLSGERGSGGRPEAVPDVREWVQIAPGRRAAGCRTPPAGSAGPGCAGPRGSFPTRHPDCFGKPGPRADGTGHRGLFIAARVPLLQAICIAEKPTPTNERNRMKKIRTGRGRDRSGGSVSSCAGGCFCRSPTRGRWPCVATRFVPGPPRWLGVRRL